MCIRDRKLNGPKIYFKRDELNHTGAHKINNCIGQVLLAKRMKKNPNGAIGWLTMVPLLGGGNYPTFAHVVLYPDMESVMKSKKAEAAEGGWRFRDKYETEYAQCSKPMLMHEKIYNRPN